MAPVTATCTTSYTKHIANFENCKNAFLLANTILSGHDVIEEFVAAEVWLISYGWQPSSIIFLKVDWAM
jgi:hypothetical protein